MYTRSWKIPLYSQFRFRIIVSDNPDEIEKHIDDFHMISNNFASCWAIDDDIVIVLNPEHSNPLTFGVVAHECYHAACFLSQAVGIELDPNNGEPQAYMMTWFMNKCMTCLYECNQVYKMVLNI